MIAINSDVAVERQGAVANFLVDVGPDAGVHGGELVVAGPPDEIEQEERSLTGNYLRGDMTVPIPAAPRQEDRGELRIRGARRHNLEGIDVAIPLGRFCAVTGVSGSGKSTLVHDVLVPWLRQHLMRADAVPSHCRDIEGLEQLDKVIEINQAPIGRTPRSNAATYTDVWTHIRDLFAMLPESRLRQYKKGRFSFNVAGGRCEPCGGAGVTTLTMNFLAPVEVVCEECGGARFNAETLSVRWQGKSVHDVLEMTVDEAAALFADQPKIARGLNALQDVGLGYIRLGQPSTTLSGGEAQRVKLATELQRPATGKTFYVLDEPTTGLHFHDVTRLLQALQRLVDTGNTVLVIEHNLDVVRATDWIIDLGPEGGDGGGTVVATGTPADVAGVEDSHTGAALRALGIGGNRRRRPGRNVRGRRARASRAGTQNTIAVRGARTHNLQGIDCDVPLGRFTVVTGPSGSGKSSLAFDTVFQEGQRRFLESMSTYARRFLGRLDRAPVDRIDGLGPAIAIDQRRTARSPRSTVATTTEIHDYLRLLFARIGRPHCPTHGQELIAFSPSKAAAMLCAELDGAKAHVLAPIRPPGDIGTDARRWRSWLDRLYADWQKHGYVRVMLDGKEQRLDAGPPRGGPVELMLVIDRITIGDRARLSDSIEQAHAASGEHQAGGVAVVQTRDGQRHWFRTDRACHLCGFEAPSDPHPRWFSFNHHSGACPTCLGLGEVVLCVEELLVNHPELPTFGGAIQHRGAAFTFLTRAEGWYAEVAAQVAQAHGFDLDKPWRGLSKKARRLLLRGAGDERFDVVFRKREAGRKREWRMSVPWKGLARQVEEWFHGRDGDDNAGDERYRQVMQAQPCPDCLGERLLPGPRHVFVGDVRLPELLAMTVDDAFERLARLKLDRTSRRIATEVLAELAHRLSFLRETGLGYLTLDRSAATLSGGEAQRIRLATQLGNKLVGVLYVLDEPTVGLHPRDTERLLRTLLELRDLGNTVVTVEHDETMVRAADHVLDLGPGAGRNGGCVVAAGTPAQVAESAGLTGQWLRGEIALAAPPSRRAARGHAALRGVDVHNLDGIDIDIPLGCFTAITGVSGSGKSSLVLDALVPALRAQQPIVELDGDSARYQLVVVDQSPIGSSPSSNPATYTGVFTAIRELFAKTALARQKGFTPGRFSFHVPGGRCDHCDGKGQIQVEMHFLADVWVECEVCRGRRYNSETLSIDYRGRTIADVLLMEVDEALAFFGNHRKIVRPLQLLHDVGLGYLQLGQPANTFSGGEAQRIKLCAELATRPRSHMIYVLDEPTTGLHLDDVRKLVAVLDRLLARGDSVIVIEHHLDVIQAADQVIELGPEAGADGGQVVAMGTPEEVAGTPGSHTGRFLAARLGLQTRSARKRKITRAKSRRRAAVRKSTVEDA